MAALVMVVLSLQASPGSLLWQFLQSCTASPILAAFSGSHFSPVLPVLFCLSCSNCSGLPVLSVLFSLSCSACLFLPVLAVLLCLFRSSCPFLHVFPFSVLP
jgi:hypothetical protein